MHEKHKFHACVGWLYVVAKTGFYRPKTFVTSIEHELILSDRRGNLKHSKRIDKQRSLTKLTVWAKMRIMLTQFSRTELILGLDSTSILADKTVAVFGIGGVGSYAVEGLVRSGVGHFVLIDDDRVCLTNINRQLIATQRTIGKAKVEVMRDRILEINPSATVEIHQCFYGKETADQFDLLKWSYIIDCIDTVSSKLLLVETAVKNSIPILSCMGAGNKVDPTKFEITDIKKTSVCPLARVMRQELKKRRISKLKVLYSREIPIKPAESGENKCKKSCICPSGTTRKCTTRRQIPGSVSFVPSVAGLIIAGEVIKDLLRMSRK
jgi:tRNA A37 threonylcarbamoyladenosine dehydratase